MNDPPPAWSTAAAARTWQHRSIEIDVERAAGMLLQLKYLRTFLLSPQLAVQVQIRDWVHSGNRHCYNGQQGSQIDEALRTIQFVSLGGYLWGSGGDKPLLSYLLRGVSGMNACEARSFPRPLRDLPSLDFWAHRGHRGAQSGQLAPLGRPWGDLIGGT